MHAQLIPTTLSREATDAFADLLKGRADDGLNDDHFARDWSSLWDELVRDGWTAIADSADGDFSLLDLTAFARAWGRYLGPPPFPPAVGAPARPAPPPGPGPPPHLRGRRARPHAAAIRAGRCRGAH